MVIKVNVTIPDDFIEQHEKFGVAFSDALDIAWEKMVEKQATTIHAEQHLIDQGLLTVSAWHYVMAQFLKRGRW